MRNLDLIKCTVGNLYFILIQITVSLKPRKSDLVGWMSKERVKSAMRQAGRYKIIMGMKRDG